MKKNYSFSPNHQVFSFLVLSFAIGSLMLAIIDPSTRNSYIDLTKIAVGAYIGLRIPSSNDTSE